MELQVRDARLTDIDRITSMLERSDSHAAGDGVSNAADLLRQLVYLPNAAVIVALDGRLVVGAAVLGLRPSVAAGGLVGSVDLLLTESGHELDGVAEALLMELVRSARNKGCVSLDGALPDDAADVARWERLGFREAGMRLSRSLARTQTPAR